jgi:hypothetical protein
VQPTLEEEREIDFYRETRTVAKIFKIKIEWKIFRDKRGKIITN